MFKLVLNTPKKVSNEIKPQKKYLWELFKFLPNEIAEWKISHPPKNFVRPRLQSSPSPKKQTNGIVFASPIMLYGYLFPSKQAVLCSSQWLGKVIPLDPHTVFSRSGHDFLQIQAAFLPTIAHSWPAWHRILVHGSKIRIWVNYNYYYLKCQQEKCSKQTFPKFSSTFDMDK